MENKYEQSTQKSRYMIYKKSTIKNRISNSMILLMSRIFKSKDRL